MITNDNDFRKLTAKQYRALDALLTTGSQSEAAKMAGISPVTMSRYMRNPSFVWELNERRRRLVNDARSLFTYEALSSVKTLACLRDDSSTPAGVRMRSAEALLKLAIADNQEQRIAAIERAISELDENYNGN